MKAAVEEVRIMRPHGEGEERRWGRASWVKRMGEPKREDRGKR